MKTKGQEIIEPLHIVICVNPKIFILQVNLNKNEKFIKIFD